MILMVALFLVNECTFCNAFVCKWCWIKSLTVRSCFSSEHSAVVCRPVKPLRRIQPAVNTMNSTWSKTKAHRKLIATKQFCSQTGSWCGFSAQVHVFYHCIQENTEVHLDRSRYHKVNNFSFFLTLFRPSPGSSNAPANIPSDRHGRCGHLPSSCSASAAPCGLDKRWRTTGSVDGNEK